MKSNSFVWCTQSVQIFKKKKTREKIKNTKKTVKKRVTTNRKNYFEISVICKKIKIK